MIDPILCLGNKLKWLSHPCVHVYVYMYIYPYLYAHISMPAYTHSLSCMQKCPCLHVQTSMHVFTHTRTGVLDYATGIHVRANGYTRTYYRTFKKHLRNVLTWANLTTKEVQTSCAFFPRWYICIRLCYSMISLFRRCDFVRNQFSFRLQSSFRYSYSMSLRLALKATQEQALAP